MDTIGIDLYQRESQVCILTDDGELFERRITMTGERLTLSWTGGRRAGCWQPRHGTKQPEVGSQDRLVGEQATQSSLILLIADHHQL